MTTKAAPDRLDVYEIACLSGGPDRMVDTALVALVELGRVQVTSPGELATASLARQHPVEAAVLDAVGPAGHRSVETIRWRLTTDDRILEVPRRLRDLGLLGSAGVVPAARRSRWRLAPTYAGRHRLHELLDDPPVDDVAGGTSAMIVALRGREHMPDKALCAAIFEQPASTVAPGLQGRPPHDLDFADGWQAAQRTRAAILARAMDTMGGGQGT
jgi:hypothetical protein